MGGKAPLLYGDIEHNPYNIVILTGFITGLMSFPGTFLGYSFAHIVLVLSGLDLIWDFTQDIRHAVPETF